MIAVNSRSGADCYYIVVATSVAEEGLDFPVGLLSLSTEAWVHAAVRTDNLLVNQE